MSNRNHNPGARTLVDGSGIHAKEPLTTRELVRRLNDAAAIFGVVQRSLERLEIGSDEATMLRLGITSLLLVYDHLDKLTGARRRKDIGYPRSPQPEAGRRRAAPQGQARQATGRAQRAAVDPRG
jgi:hypothetical protein